MKKTNLISVMILFALTLLTISCGGNKKEKIILYSGTLDSRYGITNLIDAFKSINNDNYKLWVCGEGNSKDIIEELSKSDSRVVYFGQVTTEKAVELQNLATLLIKTTKYLNFLIKY